MPEKKMPQADVDALDRLQMILSGDPPPDAGYKLGGFSPQGVAQSMQHTTAQQSLGQKSMGEIFDMLYMMDVRKPLIEQRTRAESAQADRLSKTVDVPTGIEGVGSLTLLHGEAADFISSMASTDARAAQGTAAFENYIGTVRDWQNKNVGKPLPEHLRTWAGWQIHLTGLRAGATQAATEPKRIEGEERRGEATLVSKFKGPTFDSKADDAYAEQSSVLSGLEDDPSIRTRWKKDWMNDQILAAFPDARYGSPTADGPKGWYIYRNGKWKLIRGE